MLHHLRTLCVASTVAVTLGAGAIAAQTPGSLDTDSRWFAWLGCWAPDTSREAGATTSSPSVTCIIPVEGSRSPEALTVARGAVINRDRLDASGRPHPVDGNGCRGTETVNWSASNRRVYTYSDFTCSRGIPGSTISLFAIATTGHWVRVEKTRSGSGSLVSVTKLRPTTLSNALTVTTIRTIESQQRTIATARAAAATPISSDEILDAVRNLDGDVVLSWLATSGQAWSFNATQIVALENAGVPIPILQIIGGRMIVSEVAPVTVIAPAAPVAVVYDEPPPQMTTLRQCGPNTCPGRYSLYNGYDPYAMPYGSPPFPFPYPYTPFGYPAFSSFVATPLVNRTTINKFDGRDNRNGRSSHGKDSWNGGNWNGGGRNGGWSVGGGRGGSGGGGRGGSGTAGGRGTSVRVR